MKRKVSQLALFLVISALAPTSAAIAQRVEESEIERQARLARRGAGIRVGVWNVDLDEPSGTSWDRSPHFEGYFQRGMDRHLALENSVSVIQLKSNVTTVGPLPGTADTTETKSYLVPLMTALKLYPITTVNDRVEPWLSGGVGFALGVEDQEAGTLGGGGTSIVTGFGFRAGAGAEFHLSSAFGLQASARYQWLKYGENMGAADIFRGFGFEGGLTYRFQF